MLDDGGGGESAQNGKWDACLFAHVCCVVGLYEERVHSLISRENVNTNVLYTWRYVHCSPSNWYVLSVYDWLATLIFDEHLCAFLSCTPPAPGVQWSFVYRSSAPLFPLYIVTAQQRSGQHSTGENIGIRRRDFLLRSFSVLPTERAASSCLKPKDDD